MRFLLRTLQSWNRPRKSHKLRGLLRLQKVWQFYKEHLSYERILFDQITFDFRNKFGIYSPELDLDSAIIKIANGSGYMIPHRVKEIKADPDRYLDQYKMCALLFKELHDN